MTSFLQLLLVIVVSTLTFLVTFAAIQVFHILHEFRQSIQRLNRILDHTHSLAATAARPITAVNEFFTEVKDLVNVTQDQIIDNTEDRVITPHHESGKKRFFRRSGLPIHPS